jgi:hypothetical protein
MVSIIGVQQDFILAPTRSGLLLVKEGTHSAEAMCAERINEDKGNAMMARAFLVCMLIVASLIIFL